jgi:energy-coupling factor transport system permease protein
MIDVLSGKLRGNTYIFRLDPRTKFLSLLVLFVSLVLIHRVEYYLFWFIVLFIIILTNKINFKSIVKPLKLFVWLFLLTLIFHSLFTSGKVIFHWGRIYITIEGIEKGVLFSFRLFLIIVSTYLFSLTTEPMALIDGLAKFFSPLRKWKIPVYDIFVIVHITLRFIPTLFEQFRKILLAQRARGLDLNVGPYKRIKRIPIIIVPVVLLSIKRADELALALEARWYRPGKERTSFIEMKVKPLDYFAVLLLIIFSGGIQVCEILK